MKVFVAGFAQETNTFSNIPTSKQCFDVISTGDDDGKEDNEIDNPLDVQTIWRSQSREKNAEFSSSIFTWAQPAGRISQTVYESYRDQIIDDLKATTAVDIVLLFLHGAMVSESCDDCEGDILSHVRATVGPRAVIGCLLDPHAHLSEKMTNQADFLIFAKEYPHTDFFDRAKELFSLSWRAANREISPHTSVFDCRMIRFWGTQSEPVRDFVDKLMTLEGTDDILSISFIHGFPYGDVEDLGSKILVITNDQTEKGMQLAEQLGRQVWDMRFEESRPISTVDEALEQIMRADKGPLVLAEVADNPGGGAPGDATFLLQSILEHKVTDVVFACIYDPIAVDLCTQAGQGTVFDLRIGGKSGPESGVPVDLTVKVKHLKRDVHQTVFEEGQTASIGDTACVSSHGIDIILCNIRTQIFSPDAIKNAGLNPDSYKAIVVKSTNHFYAGFAPIARDILFVNTPGALNPDFTQVGYSKLVRDIWPLVENPF